LARRSGPVRQHEPAETKGKIIMTKSQQSERDQYIAKLREALKPGDTLHTVLRSVSRSGMSRVQEMERVAS
jgi:hypothetical protein